MTDSLLTDQVGVSVAIVYALELVKRSSWFPWVQQNTAIINRVIAGIAAFLTSVGFHFAMVGNWQAGGTLTITIPAFATMVSVLLHSLGQVGIQEAFYQSAVKPTPPPTTPPTS